ncbi:MAG: ATP-binding protein [Terracidiphilus sp.]
MGAVTDLTERKRAEEALRQAQADLDEVRAAVTRFARDAQRATEIFKRIRSQFEEGSVNQETLGVSEMIRETVALLRDEAMRYNISVRTDLAADLPQIVGDRVQLQQVAMNLIVNSIEAMKDVGGIRELVIKSQRTEDEQLLVSVSDTGPGFPPERAEQIFDPFFTTKPHGTGMGLRISRSIVESHGGRLRAVGTPGRRNVSHKPARCESRSYIIAGACVSLQGGPGELRLRLKPRLRPELDVGPQTWRLLACHVLDVPDSGARIEYPQFTASPFKFHRFNTKPLRDEGLSRVMAHKLYWFLLTRTKHLSAM